ncbi:hemerythrin domain-containing protein [Nocardioides alcanivorans]|uniref:hemerythrin domain-containing protein n=1 Tax=Nocardioides alcanivorans TaxID=2897352 RepID=UPI001F22A843|nr:hemerythrin domain-containing protein [Nocardioides alcanivorans]
MTQDVVDLILNDHRELERQFHRLLTEPTSRPTLVPMMTALLTAHSRAEEAEVYPAARDAGAREDVEHSQKEHLEADRIARKLAATDPGSDEFASVLKELVEAVRHHIEEEEETVLVDMRKLLDERRRAQLAQAFLDARSAHLGEQPGDATKADLEQQAANVDIPVGDRTKDQLARRLDAEAEL